MRCLLILACLGLIAAADAGYETFVTGNPADVAPRTSAGLLLSGGGGDVDEAFQWLIQKAGGGDIVVLRASGSDGYNQYIPTIGPVNSVTSFVIKSPQAAEERDLIRRIGQAEGIFLAGGDQWNYVRLWKGTAIAQAIDALYRRGGPVGGSSAGLAVLGEYSFSAQYDTITSPQALADPYDKRITLETDFLHFPLLRGVITDSHFSRRDRMGRLLVFLARLGRKSRGIGIDEGTSVLVEATGSARVVGKGSAWFIRPLERAVVCRSGTPLDGARYEAVRLGAGSDSFDVLKWKGSGASYSLAVERGSVRSSLAGGMIY